MFIIIIIIVYPSFLFVFDFFFALFMTDSLMDICWERAVRPLGFVSGSLVDICWERAVLLALFLTAWWTSAWKELSPWLLCCLYVLSSLVGVLGAGYRIRLYRFMIISLSSTSENSEQDEKLRVFAKLDFTQNGKPTRKTF